MSWDKINKCKYCIHFIRNSDKSLYGTCNALKITEVFDESDIDLQDADIVDYTTFEDGSCSYSYVSENFGCIKFANEIGYSVQKI